MADLSAIVRDYAPRHLFDFESIRAAGILPDVAQRAGVKLRRAGRDFVALCPFHKERTPSFYIYDDGRKGKCHGCGWQGDTIDFERAMHGGTTIDALQSLAAVPANTRPILTPRPDRTPEAVAIWEAAAGATGTAAETYLAGRGIHILLPPAIRFTRLSYGTGGAIYPVMVALVTDVAGKPIGIQRTYLAHDGKGKAAIPKPKLSLGSIGGSAVRLAAHNGELIVTEGLEDALTLFQQLGIPTWAALGTSGLQTLQLPDEVRCVTIGADNDDAGEIAAQRAAERFTREGRTVRIMRPRAHFKDFNEQLQGLAQ